MYSFNTLIEKFKDSPDCINDRNYRFYALLKVVCSVGLLTHFLWIFLFYFLEVPELSYINIVSVSLFILAFYVNQKGMFLLAISIGIIEVTTHQIIGSIYIGTDAGFQYYIIIASFLPFLLPYGRSWFKALLLISSLVAFLYIEYFIQGTTPLYILEPDTILFLGYSNIIFAFSFLGIWGIYFSIAILSTEKKLHSEIEKSANLLLSVEKKSEELEVKNIAIQDSLNYSEKIQRSILPQLVEIQQDIPDSFVYFQPKDVIGGDFYWYFKKENHCFIAAIDCTGHGVPGALMSMTIYALLNEIMIKEMVTDPGEILSLLHKNLSNTLNQDKGDKYAQDGCDASLCRLDLESNELVFSGAQNDLFIYNEDELTVLKADRKSIGGLTMLGEFEAERIFKSQVINLSKKDFILLTTDGIPDQLDKSDEAFSVKEFKKVIQRMYSAETKELKKLVEAEITDWKNGVQQQDDFLILGFKASSIQSVN